MKQTAFSIGFIGAGRLATQLAMGLQAAGHHIRAVYSRTLASAERLSEHLGNGEGRVVTNRLADMPSCDLFIIAVPDKAVADMAGQWGALGKGGVVVHTAGSMPMDLLSPAALHYGVFYPMQTFTKEKKVDFTQVFIYIEASDASTLQLLQELGASLSPHVAELSSADRQFLHLGAVMACNFSNHLFDLAFSFLSRHGIEPGCLLPLIDETVRKLQEMHPHDGQTGPAARRDMEVIAHHLSMLQNDKDLLLIYKTLTESILGHSILPAAK